MHDLFSVRREVTYANKNQSGTADGILIEEGKQVRENQTIIRLPNASLLRVRAKVNENRIEHVRPGMDCVIRLDAMPISSWPGKLKMLVNTLAFSQSLYLSYKRIRYGYRNH